MILQTVSQPVGSDCGCCFRAGILLDHLENWRRVILFDLEFPEAFISCSVMLDFDPDIPQRDIDDSPSASFMYTSRPHSLISPSFES